SLAWEGMNSHNCGLIISSIKTNSTKEISNHDQVSIEELEYAQNALGEFGGNNRTGIAGTLHRISAIKNGKVVGLTCRLGRPVREIIDMTRDLLENGKSILFLGRPGVGKATVIVSHVLSYEHLKKLLFDTSNEIGGDHQPEEFEQPLRQAVLLHFLLLLLLLAPAAFLLLLLLHCSAGWCCCTTLLPLLRFAPAAAAATLCCCVLLLLQLRFANAAAVFCCCCSLLRGSNPMVLTGSLAWEGTNSHNCGLIISSIKTNSTKEISNHDQVTLDLGRLPQACYLGDSGKRDLRKKEVSIEELEYAQNALGEFGGNNRTGIAGTLHRISAIKNKNGRVVGLTCRLGRPVREIIDMTRDLLENGKSILFLGRPGVGKTTVIRGISHVLSYELLKRVIVVDTSNEIGDIRESISIVSLSCSIWIRDVDFQMQIVVDTSNEIGVILSDEAARTRNCKKIILERRSAPAFPFLIEMRERDYWVAHRSSTILVDDILAL
ncbi:putative protein ycf45, partial [Sesamum angolense]